LRKKTERQNHLPVMPNELLIPEIRERISGRLNSRMIFKGLADILSRQTTYAKSLPVVQMALAIQSLYSEPVEFQLTEREEIPFSQEELHQLGLKAVARLQRHIANKYVEKEKLTQYQLKAHLFAAHEILMSAFSENDRDQENGSYFSVLKKHYPGLTDKMYKMKHRVFLEYFTKIAKREMREILRSELNIP